MVYRKVVAKAIVGKKIPRLHGRAGSIPALGTIFMFHRLWRYV